VQTAGLLVIGDLAPTPKDIMALKEELSSIVETIPKDGRGNMLPINQSLSTKMSRVSYFGPALFFPYCRCFLQKKRLSDTLHFTGVRLLSQSTISCVDGSLNGMLIMTIWYR